jgi:hypothetical protein
MIYVLDFWPPRDCCGSFQFLEASNAQQVQGRLINGGDDLQLAALIIKVKHSFQRRF